MDVRRHATAGRLAELFGEPALESDRFVRAMGWRGVAEQELALIKPETRAALEQYAEGVNAYLEDRDPSDIAVALHDPQRRRARLPARAVDRRSTPWPGSRRWRGTCAATWTRRSAGPCRSRPSGRSGPRTSTRATTTPRTSRSCPRVRWSTVSSSRTRPRTAPASRSGRRGADVPAVAAALRRGSASTRCRRSSARGRRPGQQLLGGRRRRTRRPGRRSSPTTRTWAWACRASGSRWACTAGPCRRPARWTSPGFTFSGVPGVIIGHNADIAWGFTNLGPDVTDLYVERVRGDEWFRDGEWQPLRPATETIEVAGAGRRDARASGRPRTGRCSPTSRTTSTTSPTTRRRRAGTRRDRRGLRAGPAVDGARAGPHRRRDLRPQPGRRLGRVPGGRLVVRGAGPEPRLRRPGGPHRLPGARPDPDPEVRATTG